jgi:hypothetical protein
MGTGYLPDGSSQAAIWAGVTDEWDPIPLPAGFEPCGGSGLSFYDMGGNADFATGLTWEGCAVANAYRWDAASDMTVNLGSMNAENSRGNAISEDGSTIVGWNEMLCGSRRGARWDDGQWNWIDGNGDIEPRQCAESGAWCCSDSYCPEVNVGTCEDNVCVGGQLEGAACNWDSDCPNSNEGYCDQGTLTCVGGTEEGKECTSNWSCGDTAVCLDNPDWAAAAQNYKGEVFDVSGDGKYAFGRNFGDSDYNSPDYDPYLWASAYVQGPNGSFTQVLPPPDASPYDSWTPYRISDNGKTAVGTYGWWIYSYPTVWTEATGTLDLQWFLIGQGLDDLWYWYLRTASVVSADGTIIGGDGYNPDYWIEGYRLDMSKVSICHMPGGDFDKARTLTISLDSVGDHVAHGDPLMTCEFYARGARSRASLRADHPTANGAAAKTFLAPDNDIYVVEPGAPRVRSSYAGASEFTRPERQEQPAARRVQQRERSPRTR